MSATAIDNVESAVQAADTDRLFTQETAALDENDVRDVMAARYLGRRPWLYPLFLCCRKCDSCLEAHACFFCQLSRQYNTLYNLQPSIHVPLCVCSMLWNYVLGNMVSCLLVWSLRSDLRHRYGIEGHRCCDGCVAMCCGPCALQQQLLELTALGSCPGGLCMNDPADVAVMW